MAPICFRVQYISHEKLRNNSSYVKTDAICVPWKIGASSSLKLPTFSSQSADVFAGYMLMFFLGKLAMFLDSHHVKVFVYPNAELAS